MIFKLNNRIEKIVLLVSVLFVLMFVIGGCQPLSYTDFSMKDLRKGSQGLEIEFLKNTPPPILYENDPNVFISLLVSNKGASDIIKGAIAISREEDYLSFDKINIEGVQVQEPILFNLKGKSLSNIYGDSYPFEIDAHTNSLTLSKFQDTLITATGCYDYRTVFSESVCIEPDQYKNDNIEQACIARDLSPSTQGAPVNVKRVIMQSKKLSNNQVRNVFRITVENDGNGRVTATGITQQMCSSKTIQGAKDLDYKKAWDVVKIDAAIGASNMTCNNNGIVVLDEGETGETICKVDIKQSDTHVNILKIQLDYGYTFTVSKSFKIEKV